MPLAWPSSAMAFGRFLKSLLYEVEGDDPLTFGVVVGAVLAAALAACCIPARRAARANPMTMLRQE
jgi:putative ABC transport system permease protein